MRPDTWLPRRGKITVVVDPPIEPNPQGERTDSGAWAEAGIADLLAEGPLPARL